MKFLDGPSKMILRGTRLKADQSSGDVAPFLWERGHRTTPELGREDRESATGLRKRDVGGRAWCNFGGGK